MDNEQLNTEMNPSHMQAEQLALLKSLEAAQKSVLRQQVGTAETQHEMFATLYRFMRVTVDIQEVMLKRLNVISYAAIVLAVTSLIGVFVLLTQ